MSNLVLFIMLELPVSIAMLGLVIMLLIVTWKFINDD